MAKKVVKTDTEKVAKLARPGKYVYYFGDGKADGDRTMKTCSAERARASQR